MSKLIADVMTQSPITVKPETSLEEAIQLLAEHKISGLPVVDDQHNIVGILSETDLMWQAMGTPLPAYIMVLDSVIYLKNPAQYQQELHKALGQTVKDAMTEHVVSTKPDASVRQAAQLMHDHKIRRLPVINAEHKLVGILTRGDIVREMAQSAQMQTQTS
ncbi:MAG: CBS domain-containing protein [Cyanobacteria bacterium P01_A01_bin.123]